MPHRMEIIEATAPSKVVLKLDFIKPFEAHNRVGFTITPQADSSSAITWDMQGPTPFIGYGALATPTASTAS